jgi:uncharacterized protein YdgA (DUF945 family)
MRTNVRYVVVLVIIVVSIAVIPFVNGYLFKNSYINLVNSSDALKITEYHLGWFSSDVKLSFKDTVPVSDPASEVLQEGTIIQHIVHGPFAKNPMDGSRKYARALIISEGHASKEAEGIFLGPLASHGIFQATTYVSYNGLYSSRIETPIFSFSAGGLGKFVWQGMKGLIDVVINNNVVNGIKSDMVVGPVSIQMGPNSFTTQSMTIQGEQTCPPTALLCSGRGTIAIPDIRSNFPQAIFKITNFNFACNSGVNERNTYDSDITITMNKLEVPDYTIGPVNIKIVTTDINTDALKKIKDIYEKRNSSIQNDVMLGQYNNELSALILPTTTVTENASVKTSFGDFSSDAKFSWPANTPLPKNINELTKANVKINLRIAIPLVDQVIKKMDEQLAAKTPPKVLVPVVDPSDMMKIELDKWVLEKKITDDTRKLILELEDQHFDPDIFKVSMNKLIADKVLPEDQGRQLEMQYAKAFTTDADATLMSSTSDTAGNVTNSNTPALNNETENQKKLNELIKLGYIVQDKNDYVTVLTYENGVMKANGIVVQPSPIMPVN